MFHLAEDIDSVTLAALAESARVESRIVGFDTVVTKIAFDQTQLITRPQGDSVVETTNEKQFSLVRLDLVPNSSALVLESQPASAVDDLATSVASFLTEYNYLDSKISDLSDDLLVQERKLKKRSNDELLPLAKQMWMLLSQRGDLHGLVLGDRALASELSQLEDVPTWTEWYEAFSNRIVDAPSLRTIQRKLKKLRDKTKPATDPDVDPVGDDTDDDTAESSPLDGFDLCGEVKSAAELLAEHAKIMLDVLAGKSIMSDAMRITRAVRLVKDLQRALEEGFLVVTASKPGPKVPVIECEIIPDGTRDAMATLRSIFNRMADTADIENALQEALEEFVQPMIAEHPYMQADAPFRPELQVSVTLYRPGHARINAGDWVEYRGDDDRLKKQIGAEAALGHVVEAGGFSRPRTTWFNGTKWVKPYVLFDEEAVHVLFADQASVLYPDAFNSYSEPTSKPHAAIATMEADASASSATCDVAAPAAPAVAHGLEDARENPTLSNAVSHLPTESLAEDNLPADSVGPVTQGFLPHGDATRTQLMPGRNYQVRPAPSGGYGIYEGRSPVLVQWFAEEDDARDAIDHVSASVLVA